MKAPLSIADTGVFETKYHAAPVLSGWMGETTMKSFPEKNVADSPLFSESHPLMSGMEKTALFEPVSEPSVAPIIIPDELMNCVLVPSKIELPSRMLPRFESTMSIPASPTVLKSEFFIATDTCAERTRSPSIVTITGSVIVATWSIISSCALSGGSPVVLSFFILPSTSFM